MPLTKDKWFPVGTLEDLDPDKPCRKVSMSTNVGYEWTAKDGRRYKTGYGRRKPHLTLKIRTWAGISAGAMHYYGEASTPSMQTVGVGHSFIGLGGYGPSRPDKILHCITMEAKRKLHKPEKNMAGEQLCKVGEWTNCFNTPEDAWYCLIEQLHMRFTQGWPVYIDHYRNGSIGPEETGWMVRDMKPHKKFYDYMLARIDAYQEC